VLSLRIALCILCAGAAAPADARPLPYDHLRRAVTPLGERQRQYFLARLGATADRIDRQEDVQSISHGQAAFMRQDLDRVWLGVCDDIRRAGELTGLAQASYAAMLRRVDLRLIQAGTRRIAHRSVREQ
jgi:hypothetical protein